MTGKFVKHSIFKKWGGEMEPPTNEGRKAPSFNYQTIETMKSLLLDKEQAKA